MSAGGRQDGACLLLLSDVSKYKPKRVGLFVGHFILKKWELPLSGLAVVRYSDKCGRAKDDPDQYEEFAK